MDGRRLGRLHRALRARLEWTQADVASKSGIGRNKTSELENAKLARLTVLEIDRSFAAMGAVLRISVD